MDVLCVYKYIPSISWVHIEHSQNYDGFWQGVKVRRIMRFKRVGVLEVKDASPVEGVASADVGVLAGPPSVLW